MKNLINENIIYQILKTPSNLNNDHKTHNRSIKSIKQTHFIKFKL